MILGGIILSRYLKERGERYATFAYRLGKNERDFYGLLVGKRSMNAALAVKIETLTNGAVPRTSWRIARRYTKGIAHARKAKAQADDET